jgi:6,7-dimethyl-8-ribityllumazine synthase
MADIKNSNLLHTDAGIPQLKDACIVLVKTEWNHQIVDELEKGCINKLNELGVTSIKTIIVPGAFEIGFAIKSYWDHWGTKEADAFIALGCVIKGDTPHFDYVCRAVTDAAVNLNLTLGSPTIFGVLTLDNEEQGLERIGGKHGHKGEEAAVTAVKMIALKRSYNPY